MEKLEWFLWNGSNNQITSKLCDFKTKDDFNVFLKNYIVNSEKNEFHFKWCFRSVKNINEIMKI